MSSWPDINEANYAFRVEAFHGIGTVACRRCGAMVALPLPEAPSPNAIELHDLLHERVEEMWWAHHSREEAKLDD
jgi:hypothetical protein